MIIHVPEEPEKGMIAPPVAESTEVKEYSPVVWFSSTISTSPKSYENVTNRQNAFKSTEHEIGTIPGFR